MTMSRIADNLLANAVRAIDGRGRIRVRLADRDGLVLEVADDGPGMPEEFLPRAFERFSRPDASRTRTGGGLGLALVAALAEAAGGTARVANLDPGLVAEVRVPRV